jgi:hypothetical protein
VKDIWGKELDNRSFMSTDVRSGTGILVKFWDLCHNKSKNKRKLEYGLEHAMGEELKELNHAKKEA